MEIEYKWDMPTGDTPNDLVQRMERYGAHHDAIHMHAIYYDTTDGIIAAVFGGLRLRSESGRSVCCLKLATDSNDGYRTRREYEVEATDIRTGIATLPEVGAPRDLCDKLLAGDIVERCQTEFDRRAFTFTIEGDHAFTAELALDMGELRRNTFTGPIHEVELEFKGGSEEHFHAFAKKLEQDLSLVVQPRSKLARALALGE